MLDVMTKSSMFISQRKFYGTIINEMRFLISIINTSMNLSTDKNG